MSKPDEHFMPLEKRLPMLAGGGWRGSLRRALEGVLGLREIRRVLLYQSLCAHIKYLL